MQPAMTGAPRVGPEGPEGEGPAAARRPRLVRFALAFYGALLAAALLWRGAADGVLPLWTEPGAGVAPLRDLAAGLALAAVALLLSRLWTARSAAGRRLARALAEAIGPLDRGRILLLAGLSGLAEEAFFRGALQPQVGLLAASALFGLAHLAPRRELAPWALFAALAGLAFGALFEATGNLLAPAVAHVTVNAVNLRWLVGPGAAPPAA